MGLNSPWPHELARLCHAGCSGREATRVTARHGTQAHASSHRVCGRQKEGIRRATIMHAPPCLGPTQATVRKINSGAIPRLPNRQRREIKFADKSNGAREKQWSNTSLTQSTTMGNQIRRQKLRCARETVEQYLACPIDNDGKSNSPTKATVRERNSGAIPRLPNSHGK